MMTPLAWLERNTLFLTLAFEPATMRIPLPPVLPNDIRPLMTFCGGALAPGVCWIQTPAATLPFVSTVPVPPDALVTTPVRLMDPAASTRMPCAVLSMNVVGVLPEGTLMVAAPVPVRWR